MPKFKIECIDRSTGKSSIRLCTCASEENARKLVSERGYDVGRIWTEVEANSVAKASESARRTSQVRVPSWVWPTLIGAVVAVVGLFGIIIWLVFESREISPADPNRVVMESSALPLQSGEELQAAPGNGQQASGSVDEGLTPPSVQVSRPPEPRSTIDASQEEQSHSDPLPKAHSEAEQPNVAAAPAVALMPLSEALSLLMLTKSEWSLGIDFAEPEYAPKSNKDIQLALGNIEKYAPAPDSKPWEHANYALLVQHRERLNDLMPWLSMVGREQTYFLCGDDLPIHFIAVNGSPGVVFHDIGISKIYDARNTTAGARAAEIVGSCILPTLEALDQLYAAEIPWYGIAITYGCKDPSKVELSPAEIVLMITSRDDCHRFENAEITKQELIRRAMFFHSDSDMGLVGGKRIEIELR